MNETLTRRVILPLHEQLRHRKTMQYFRSLAQTRRLNPEELHDLRFQKLRRLLFHSYEEVPYYRQLFQAANFDPTNGLVRSDLRRIPPLNKDLIRRNLEDLKARNYVKKLIGNSTAGSTGSPLIFFTDHGKEAQHNAYKLHARTWFGIQPGDRQVDVWASPIELNKLTRFRRWKDRYLLNQMLLPANDLSEGCLLSFAQFIVRFKPQLLYGYPSAIYLLSKYIQDSKFPLSGYSPKTVVCTSEMLLSYQRQGISMTFGCPVVNEYGSRDGGLIAHECQLGGLHIAAEHVYVEVENANEDGEGDLLITNLDGYGMPFIRYRIGDRASLSQEMCSCGLNLPLMKQLSGRSRDFIISSTGRVVHSAAIAPMFRELTKLRQFKIVQRRTGKLIIYLVSEPPLVEQELESIRQKMRRLMDADMEMEFVLDQVIQPEKSGKHRYVVSEIDLAKIPN